MYYKNVVVQKLNMLIQLLQKCSSINVGYDLHYYKSVVRYNKNILQKCSSEELQMQEKIKRLRLALLYSQREFAKIVGVSESIIPKWELGTSRPSITNQRKLKELAEKHGMEW